MLNEHHQKVCPDCQYDLEWIDCWNGCDDGYFDGFEEDPLWYDEGDEIRCDVCKGKGRWNGCTNGDCESDCENLDELEANT